MTHTMDERPSGLSGSTLKAIGLVFAAAGMIGRGILQNGILGVGSLTPQQLLEMMGTSSQMMAVATAALVLQAVSTCAIPIFSMLLVEGFANTENFLQDLLWLCGLAVVGEIPYNLAMHGKLIDVSSCNPVFGLVLGLMVLYFYDRYQRNNILVRTLVTAAALGWCIMLHVDEGVPLILVICVLWLFRRNTLYRNFIGASAAVVCSFMSPFYLASPMGFIAVHLYHGNRGEGSRFLQYGAYPVLLLLTGIIAILIRG